MHGVAIRLVVLRDGAGGIASQLTEGRESGFGDPIRRTPDAENRQRPAGGVEDRRRHAPRRRLVLAAANPETLLASVPSSASNAALLVMVAWV